MSVWEEIGLVIKKEKKDTWTVEIEVHTELKAKAGFEFEQEGKNVRVIAWETYYYPAGIKTWKNEYAVIENVDIETAKDIVLFENDEENETTIRLIEKTFNVVSWFSDEDRDWYFYDTREQRLIVMDGDTYELFETRDAEAIREIAELADYHMPGWEEDAPAWLLSLLKERR